MLTAEVSGVSAIAASSKFVRVLDGWPRVVPFRATAAPLGPPVVRGARARSGATPPSGTLAPRALPLADMPDVTCCLLMASQAALLSIMSHRRHVQTGVPMTHLYPENHL